MSQALKVPMLEEVASDAELTVTELRESGIACRVQNVETEAKFR